MNWKKGFGRKHVWPNRVNVPGFAWKRKNQADVQTKIRTHHLSNMNLEFHHYTNLLGEKLWSLYSVRAP
jgi:hypothetical protein